MPRVPDRATLRDVARIAGQDRVGLLFGVVEIELKEMGNEGFRGVRFGRHPGRGNTGPSLHFGRRRSLGGDCATVSPAHLQHPM